MICLREVYLDNSATTRVCEEAAQKALEIMTEKYGNPSSLHSKGIEAQHELEAARKACADMLSADSGEIYFTSGGTESNNTALFGAARALKRRGNRIITTAVEHSSVIEAAAELEKNGFEVIYLEPDKSGRINIDDLKKAVNDKTILVSIMAVNNETGAVQPIENAGRIIHRAAPDALFHVDFVQGFGKLPLKPKKLGIDLLSASSHKIHGPKGAGILYIRKGARIIPLHYGGEQQKKLRPGTEPVAAACGMGAAVKALPDMQSENAYIKDINMYLREKLSGIKNITINSGEECLPYILNFSAVGIRSETMLHYLEERNIFVSSGSACAKGKKSHVLKAMGLTDKQSDSAVRVSFSRFNSREDIDILVNEIINANNTLARSV